MSEASNVPNGDAIESDAGSIYLPLSYVYQEEFSIGFCNNCNLQGVMKRHQVNSDTAARQLSKSGIDDRIPLAAFLEPRRSVLLGLRNLQMQIFDSASIE
jgi:hypothetical protein